MANKPKNFRLGEMTLTNMQECMDDLGLTTEVMAIRVAIEYLHAHRKDLNVTEYLVRLRKHDRANSPHTS